MTWTRTDRTHVYTGAGTQAEEAGILGNTVFQFIQDGSGTISAVLQVSNIGGAVPQWENAGYVVLGSDGDHSYLVLINSWRYYRIDIASNSATSLKVEVSGG